MTRTIILRGGHVTDPSQGLDDVRDVLIESGRISAIDSDLPGEGKAEVIDAMGLMVSPGLVDLHAHLREPGREDEETIESGSLSAASGGITSILAMPNTDPPTDNPAAVGFILKQAALAGLAKVYPVGAVTEDLKGETMSPIGEMVDAGAVALSDDGMPVVNSEIMRRVLEYTKIFAIPVIDHCEDPNLTIDGVMNEGLLATRMGLKGMPPAAEEIMVARDVLLAKLTGGRLHIAHVSTGKSAEIIRRAKEEGVNVTAEVTPHHLSLTEEAVRGYNTNAKVNPPLRTHDDVVALREALAYGTIDCIATDHAPHHYDEKEKEFNYAPFGLIGFETALAVGVTFLVREGILTLSQLIDRMSNRPASIMGIEGGTMRIGAVADVIIFDPELRWVVDEAKLHSRSSNTPYRGMELVGKNMMTILNGNIIWESDVMKNRRKKGVGELRKKSLDKKGYKL
ncbi:MAG: dihydroorotase [Candidatus Glassbacteria bacterium]